MPPLFIIGPGGDVRAGELSRPPELLRRRPALRRRRTPASATRIASAACASSVPMEGSGYDRRDAESARVTPDLRLRAGRPRVTRLSRKVLIGLGGVSGLAIAAALIYALQTRRGDQSAKELYSTENRTTADGLTGLPRDYTGIPKLGPPLPGDLGRPILDAQTRGQPVPQRGRCRSPESLPRSSGVCRRSRRRD